MLNSMLEGNAHFEHPFEVGFPLKGRRVVHVLDEVTVEVLLEELDTVPDLVDYLSCKERYFGANGVFMHVAGEEELLAQYMCTMENGRHALPNVPPGTGSVALLEGDWRFYRSSPQPAAKREADQEYSILVWRCLSSPSLGSYQMATIEMFDPRIQNLVALSKHTSMRLSRSSGRQPTQPSLAGKSLSQSPSSTSIRWALSLC